MTTRPAPATPTTPRWSRHSPRRRPLAGALLIAATVSACGRGDVADPDATPVETGSQIGPRAIDIDRAVMMVVDSIDASNDDIQIRIRVANLSDEPLDVGNDETIYGPLITIRDDLDNTYPSLAVEPAGIYGRSIGRFDLRVEGRFDPDATEFTVELSSQRGPLITDPIPALTADTMQWWIETPTVSFPDLAVTGQSGRTVRVVDIVDRGTHLDISIVADDRSTGFSGTGEQHATLTLADGTRLESLDPDLTETREANAMTGVLRFPGTLPTESERLRLNIAGIDIDIPATPWTATAATARLAGLPQLPDLVHAKIFNDPLPTSAVTFGAD